MAIKRDLRYGGSTCDTEEYFAIMESVEESIKSGNWQAGLQAQKMEAEASKTLGVKHGILTTSGSCAGLLALASLELPKGSEVIISACTFPTIFNIIYQCGLTPMVVDAKVGTYTFDVDEVERAITKKTGAIIAIHPLGIPVDMPRLMKVARKHKIRVIEDCCDTWGGTLHGKHLGSFGDISFTSFHAAHIVSMGVGGGVFTNDKKLAENVRMYRDWGRLADTSKPHKVDTLPKDYNPRFVYEKIGYNFQLLELQAAMGRVQLRKAKKIKELRKKNYDYLVKGLSKHPLVLPQKIRGADICWFALPITYTEDRGKLVTHLEKHGIETRSMFAGNITCHPAYDNSEYVIGPDGLAEADYILRHTFWISVHPRLSKDDMDYTLKTFDDFFREQD